MARTFGVEIECNFDGGHVHECDCEFCDYEDYNDDAYLPERIERDFPEWDFRYDGSGRELVSPILEGTSGFRELKRMCDAIAHHDGSVTRQDGLHVHVGVTDFDEAGRVRLLKSWQRNRDTIAQLVSPERRLNHWACYQWDERGLAAVDEGTSIVRAQGGRRELNFLTDGYYDGEVEHVEFRLHHGTVNYDEISAWVQMCLRFVDSCATGRRPMRRYTKHELLLRRIKATKRAEKILAKKLENGGRL